MMYQVQHNHLYLSVKFAGMYYSNGAFQGLYLNTNSAAGLIELLGVAVNVFSNSELLNFQYVNI